jgi:hypothetical protein
VRSAEAGGIWEQILVDRHALVSADEVIRPINLGVLPEVGRVVRQVVVKNVPAGRLLSVQQPRVDGWVAELIAAQGRELLFKVSCCPPEQGKSRSQVDFSVFFDSDELRSARVLLTGHWGPEWDIPQQFVSLQVDSGFAARARVTHRAADPEQEECDVVVVDPLTHGKVVHAKVNRAAESSSAAEAHFDISCRWSQLDSVPSTIDLELIGPRGPSRVTFPIRMPSM